MRYIFTAVLISSLTTAPVLASLSIVEANNPQDLPINGNDFNPQLPPFVDGIYNGGANVQVDANGYLTFYYHGSESGFNNNFQVNGVTIGSEILTNDPWDGSGQQIGGIYAVTAGQLLNALPLQIGFTTDGTSSGGQNSLSGTAGFGVFYKNDLSGNQITSGYLRLFFGYDDNGANTDDNHDDMIVSVVFTPAVPEASTIAVWSILASIGGVAAYKKRKASAA